MHPELIKANLRLKGTSLTAIAQDLGVTVSAVSRTIQGARSRRIERRVAKALELPLSEVWPARYRKTTRTR